MLKNILGRLVTSNHHKRMSESTYRVVLGRRPTKNERNDTALMMITSDRFEQRLSDMLNSHEFQLAMLPKLVADSTKNWNGKRVFFLHIPKTAGTSIRVALVRLLGVPAYELYKQNTSLIDTLEFSHADFWPLYYGHENIAFFPEGYSGITIFRESRSRILSQYRQHCRAAIIDNPLDIDQVAFQEMRNVALRVLSTPFGEWLKAPSQLSSLEYFIPSKQFGRNSYEYSEFQAHVLSLSSREIEKSLNESLSRFTNAAWSHDEPAILKAISGVSGRDVDELPHENVYPNLKGYPPQILDSAALTKLSAFQEKESILFKIAHEHGLVPLLSKSEADDLFEITAKRLGFTFA